MSGLVGVLSDDALARFQALGVTPREEGETWADYLQRVEDTRKWAETGTYGETAAPAAPVSKWERGDIVAVDYSSATESYVYLGGGEWQNVTPDSRGRLGQRFRLSPNGFIWPHRLVVRGGKPVTS